MSRASVGEAETKGLKLYEGIEKFITVKYRGYNSKISAFNDGIRKGRLVGVLVATASGVR